MFQQLITGHNSINFMENQEDGEMRMSEGHQQTSRELSNTDNQEDEGLSYRPSGIKFSRHGRVYQLEVLMLFFIRACQQGSKFGLATEIEDASQFDDLLFKYEDESGYMNYRFVQVKHKLDEQKSQITFSDLLGTCKEDKGSGFNLLKYFKSYYTITKNSKFANKIKDLILYTNINFNFSDLEANGLLLKKEEENDIILNDKPLGNKEPLCYRVAKFPEKSFKDFQDSNPTLKPTKEDINEYLGFVRFAVNQPNKAELNSIIRKEMAEKFHLIDGGPMTEGLYHYMWEWMTSERGRFLTNSDQALFFKEIKQKWRKISLAGVTTDNLEKNLEYGDFFRDIKDARFLLESKGCVSLIISACATNLTFIKLVQLLKNYPTDSYAVIDAGYLLCQRNNFISVLQSNDPFTLVVELKDLNKEDQDILWNFLLQISSKLTPEQAIIVMSKTDDPFAQSLVKEDVQKISYDKCSFCELSLETQDRLLSKEVCFQGKCLPMKNLILKDFSENITEELLSDLVAGNSIEVDGPLPDLGEAENYYVTRNFRTQLIFDDKCLSDKSEHDLLVISQTSRDEIQSLVPWENVCHFKDDDYNNHLARIIVVPLFLKECTDEIKNNYFGKNIHFLIKEGGIFIWLWSADISNLCTELDLIGNAFENKLGVIAREAGLGKTTVMIHLAEQVKELMPPCWVIHISLRKNMSMLSEKQFNTVDDVIEFIIAALDLKTKFEKQLLIHRITNAGRVILLFDGFEEISQPNKLKVLTLLKILLTTAVHELLVTTRLPAQTELLTLSGSVHLHNVFSLEDHKNFIKKLWLTKTQLNPVDEKFLNLYTEKLIDNFTSSIHDYVRSVLSVPMQAQMLAELYQCRFEAEHEKRNTTVSFQFKLKIPIVPNQQVESTVERSCIIDCDLLELYEQFSQNKYAIYFQKKLRTDFNQAAAKDILDRYICILLSSLHGAIAFKRLFPENAKSLIDLANENKENAGYIEDINGVGIIKIVNGQPLFTHQAYCEYFAAYKLFNQLISMPEKTTEYDNLLSFFKEELFKESNDMIRKFLDLMLAKESDVHFAALKGNFETIKQLVSEKPQDIFKHDLFHRNPLHLAVQYNHMQICEFLMEKDQSLICTQDIFGFGVICYAVVSQSSPLLKYVLENGRRNENFSKTLKGVLQICTYKYSAMQLICWMLSIFADETQKTAIIGTINYITIFNENSIKVDFQGVPVFFAIASLQQKWEMLSANNCQFIKNVLLKYRWAPLQFCVNCLNDEMKAKICSLQEYKTAFHDSVKHLNFQMLLTLHYVGSETNLRHLWKKSYITFLKTIIKNRVMDNAAHAINTWLVHLFASDHLFEKVNFNPYFQTLFQQKQYFRASALFRYADVKQQRIIFKESDWKREFINSFERSDYITCDLLLNIIPIENRILRKLLLNGIGYTKVFQEALVQRNWQKLRMLTICRNENEEVKSMRSSLDCSMCLSLFKKILLDEADLAVTNILLKYIYSSECQKVLECVKSIEVLSDNIKNKKDVFFKANEEQRKKMVSELDQENKHKWSIWAQLLYVLLKYGTYIQPNMWVV